MGYRYDGTYVPSESGTPVYGYLHGARVLVIGDSIMSQSGFDTLHAFNGWMGHIKDKYSLDVVSEGIDGILWYSTAARPTSACTLLQNHLADQPYDYVIFEIGTNDIRSGNWGANSVETALSAEPSNAVDAHTFAGMKWCIERVQETWPGAHIVVIMPCMRNNGGKAPTNYASYKAYTDAVLDTYGIKRAYPSEEAGITLSMMHTDGIHLRQLVGGTTFTNDTQSVRRFSRCLEMALEEA